MNNLPATTSDTHPLLKPSVLDEVKSDLFGVVQAAIAQCYAHLNFPVPGIADVNYLINEVTDIIIANYPSLRLHEIPTAFGNGIRKEYGEFFGLSVVSFEQFIKGYLASPKRTNLVKDVANISETKPEPTAEDKFNTGKALCIELFEKYKASGQFGLSVLTVYEFLNSLNLIPKDYKTGIYGQALDATVANKRSEITLCTDLHKRRLLNGELEILLENIANDGITTDQHNEVLRNGKKIILKNWFDDLIMNEIDLNSLLIYKRNEQ